MIAYESRGGSLRDGSADLGADIIDTQSVVWMLSS